ncbi:MAG: hypothetical protein FIA97_07920 [Methylococcaceae bacterium]|nr:hypothetical protein [Methylococcaceae bacterium]
MDHSIVLRLLIFAMTAAEALASIETQAIEEGIRRISASFDGAPESESSGLPAISSDGHIVAFRSSADNLINGDINSVSDIFVHDTRTNKLERVSVGIEGTEANGASYFPSVSGDGRYVAFYSDASNLVSDDRNGKTDIFVHDRTSGLTQRISVSETGVEANDHSAMPAISNDGRYVAFVSAASNLVSSDNNRKADIFVVDRRSQQIRRVSVNAEGAETDQDSASPDISGDGRYVVFHSKATTLVGGDLNDSADIFLYDLHLGRIERISTGVDSLATAGNSYTPKISTDGRYVSFYSDATNLVPGDTNAKADVFLRDRQESKTLRISITSLGAEANGDSRLPAFSADARYIVFASDANNLVTSDTNGKTDIFLHDRATGDTRRLSVNISGAEANGDSYVPSISADGHWAAYVSAADNLVANDRNGKSDVFSLRVSPARP